MSGETERLVKKTRSEPDCEQLGPPGDVGFSWVCASGHDGKGIWAWPTGSARICWPGPFAASVYGTSTGHHAEAPHQHTYAERRRREKNRCRCRNHQGAVPPGPPPYSDNERLPVGRDRLVGEPPLEIIRQLTNGGVPFLRIRLHRLQADRLERSRGVASERAGSGELAAADLLQHFLGTALKRRSAGKKVVECRAKTIDVGCRTESVDLPVGLLRAHVGRCAEGRTGDRLS